MKILECSMQEWILPQAGAYIQKIIWENESKKMKLKSF